jgi:hypothetical protein
MKIKILALCIIAMFWLTSILSVTATKIIVNNDSSIALSLDESDFEKNLNENVDFEISVNTQDGAPISSFTYNILLSPHDSLSHNKNGNKIIGSFTVTKKGLYSLSIEVYDGIHDLKKEIYYYLKLILYFME